MMPAPLPPGIALEDLLAALRPLAWGAADILRAYARGQQPPHGFAAALSVEEGGDGPVSAADLAVNQWLLEGLERAFPVAPWTLLSEETAKDGPGPAVQSAEWLWLLDPLDGTRDFLQGTGEYAVHLALLHQGRPRLGVVLLPEREELWFGWLGADPAPEGSQGGDRTEGPDGSGESWGGRAAGSAGTGEAGVAVAAGGGCRGQAWRENRAGECLAPALSDRHRCEDLVLVASRNHRDARLEQLLAAIAPASSTAMGSVGGKVATILRGETDLYISLSGRTAPKDWDMAAPEAVLLAAGGAFSHADGRPLSYNDDRHLQAGCLIASHGRVHGEICARARQALAQLDPLPGAS